MPASPPPCSRWAAGHYSIERKGERWRLFHETQPLLVQGAVGWSRLDALAAAVDVMTHLWSGRWPLNRCPSLGPVPIELTATEDDRQREAATFRAGATLRARVHVSDPEGDALKVSWDVRRDVADDPRVGGDYEPLEPPISGEVVESDGDAVVIRLPESPGKYRVFVYVRDGQGGAATANVPILTE